MIQLLKTLRSYPVQFLPNRTQLLAIKFHWQVSIVRLALQYHKLTRQLLQVQRVKQLKVIQGELATNFTIIVTLQFRQQSLRHSNQLPLPPPLQQCPPKLALPLLTLKMQSQGRRKFCRTFPFAHTMIREVPGGIVSTNLIPLDHPPMILSVTLAFPVIRSIHPVFSVN